MGTVRRPSETSWLTPARVDRLEAAPRLASRTELAQAREDLALERVPGSQ